MGFPLGVAMRMGVLPSIAVFMAVVLRHGMTARIAVVAVIVPISRRRVHRVRNPALLSHLRRLGHFVIVLVATPLRMGNEAAQRGLVHVARQGHLRIPHAQGPRVARLLRDPPPPRVLPATPAGGDGKRRYHPRGPSPAVRTRLFL